MEILIINSSLKIKSNTNYLVSKLKDILTSKGLNFTEISSSEVSPCSGCGYCANKGSCIIKDRFSDILVHKWDAFIFAGPIYFFSLNSEIQKVLERFYSVSLNNAIFGYILTSGSCYENSGIDLVSNQINKINSFCGSISPPIFNKVTFDTVTEVNEADIKGLTNMVEDIIYLHSLR